VPVVSVRSLTPSLQLGRQGSPGARSENPSVPRLRLLSNTVGEIVEQV